MAAPVNPHARELDGALAAMDRAFAAVPRVGRVDGCLRCYTPRELDLLGGDPAAVSDDLVDQFAQEYVGHWAADQYGLLWRGLAPRIVRLAAGPHVEPGLLLRGLGTPEAGLWEWPSEQRAALLDALDGLLAVAVTGGWSPQMISDLLDGLSQVYGGPLPWLARIDRLAGPEADAAVVRTACEWSVGLLWGEDFGWWCGEPGTPEATVTAWLCSPPVVDRLAVFAARHPRCRTAADALVAVDALARGAPSPWYYPGYGAEPSRRRGLGELVPVRR